MEIVSANLRKPGSAESDIYGVYPDRFEIVLQPELVAEAEDDDPLKGIGL